MAVGAMEMVLVGMLGLLVAVAAVSLLVSLVAGVWLSVTPLVAEAAYRVQLWRWRDWHPPTQWVPDEDVPLEGPRPLWPPRVRGVTYLPGDGGDGTPGVVTAQVATSARTCGPQYEPVTMVHARLYRPTTLDLPARHRCSTLLYVLAGRGTVGADHRRVRAGDTALVPSGPLPVLAADARRGLEMLILERVPAAAEAGATTTCATSGAAGTAGRPPRPRFALAAKVLHPHRPAHA